MNPLRETDLYLPVKALLEGQGYTVKAEIGAVDIVALRGDEPPVIVELKLGFSLSLFHQGVSRQAMVQDVYLAVARQPGKRFARALKANVSLARRLGLGLMTVRLSDGLVQLHCDPGPFVPRRTKALQRKLLVEFARRDGDPNEGGQTRVGLVTAYRQDAMKCARLLADIGPSKGARVARETGVTRATRIMADNHHGWFDRIGRGIYALTAKGAHAVTAAGQPKQG